MDTNNEAQNNPAEDAGDIVDQLEELNEKVQSQRSLPRAFTVGIVYGIGFAIGSAIIATIIIGITLPYVQDIPWVRDLYLRGAELR